MAITLHIPDSITVGLRLPEGEIEARLRLELALALYGQGILSFGKAAELAGADRAHWPSSSRTGGFRGTTGRRNWPKT